MTSSLQPLVSVIVPTYNRAQFLAETIENILQQSYRNIEIIVVDDGSTDCTAEIIDKYRNQVRYHHQKNSGPAMARNAGIKLSRGEYVQYLDSDDKLEPNKILLQAVFLTENPDVDIVYGDARYFSNEAPDLRLFGLHGENATWTASEQWIPQLWRSGVPLLSILLERNIMPVNSALMRRNAVVGVGLWDATMLACEDWEYWMRCAARSLKFQYIEGENAMALIRSHPKSISRDFSRVDYGHYQYRIRYAQSISDPSLRVLNFHNGLGFLGNSTRQRLQRGLALLWANRSEKLVKYLFTRLWKRIRRYTAEKYLVSKG